MAFPPDTDTPGLAKENEDKPEETRLISQASSTWQPDQVAKTLLSDSLVSCLILFFKQNF